MKLKTNRDKYGRYRSITVAFRASPEENEMINRMVKISGMSKQGYIRTRLECKDVVVNGNPKVYIGLKHLLQELIEELRANNADGLAPSPETQETIKIVAKVLDDMKTKERK